MQSLRLREGISVEEQWWLAATRHWPLVSLSSMGQIHTHANKDGWGRCKLLLLMVLMGFPTNGHYFDAPCRCRLWLSNRFAWSSLAESRASARAEAEALISEKMVTRVCTFQITFSQPLAFLARPTAWTPPNAIRELEREDSINAPFSLERYLGLFRLATFHFPPSDPKLSFPSSSPLEKDNSADWKSSRVVSV